MARRNIPHSESGGNLVTDATWLQAQARTARIIVLVYERQPAIELAPRQIEAAQERLERAENNLAYFEGELYEARLQQCAAYLKGASE